MIAVEGQLYSEKKDTGYHSELRPVSVNCAGYQRFITHRFDKTRRLGRVDYQLIYISRGHGHYLIDNEIVTVGEGNALLYPPDEPQHYFYLPDGTEVYWVHFTGTDAGKLIADMDRITHTGLSNNIAQLFEAMIKSLQIKRPMFEDITDALFLQLLATVKQLSQEYKSGRIDTDIEGLIINLNNNYSDSWTLDKLAAMCDLSKYRLVHKFKAYTGLSPINYITKLRMDKACELLSESTLRINEIAAVLGYDNPLYFSRFFHKKNGCSPYDYRRKTLENGNRQ